MVVFDTGPLVAAAISDDAYHHAATELLTSLRLAGEKIFVPATVVAEVGYILGRGGHHEREAQFLESMADGTLTQADLTPDDYARAAELVRRYADLPLGTTDASVMALCERLGVTEVATLDHRHFTVVRPRHVEALRLMPFR